MGKRISDWMRRVSTGWVALAALLIFLLFTALVLPQQAAKSQQETGSAVSPDTSFFYAPADLYQIAESYGEAGREAYIRARFTFDLVWPMVYTLFLATAISWVFGKAFAPDSLWQRANLVPLVGALFDYLENLSTSLVMLRYPAQTPVVDLLAPVFTALKWGFLGVSFVLLCGGIVVAVWRWMTQRAWG
ncbi:MAG: hypothetical protein PVI80_20660 [Anaerolineae bacterium]|jgi:hypothetical protein